MPPWSRFREIKKALDRADIEGLLALKCPPDEYDGEASLIESRVAQITDFGKKPLSVDQAENIVAEVWNSQFGPFSDEDVERRRPAFASVAREIAAH